MTLTEGPRKLYEFSGMVHLIEKDWKGKGDFIQ